MKTYTEECNIITFLYWANRRQRTATTIRWDLGSFVALDDASYCLDRPHSIYE